MALRYLTNFVGRQSQIELLTSWYAGAGRLATVLSPGGFGKTRLLDRFVSESAVEPRKRVVSWEEERGSLGLVDSLLASLRLAESTQRSKVDPTQVLIELLQRREVELLVLDGIEKDLDEAQELVGRVLTEVGGAKILLSSRVELGIPGEQWIELPPLGIRDVADEAGALLLARCSDYGIDIEESDREVLGAIARIVDGIPLALEMVAARLRMVAPGTLLRLLEEDLAALGEAESVGLPGGKHKSLEQVVGWSLDRLDAEHRRALGQLSLLTGAFSVEGAALCLECGVGAALTVLEALCRAGLLQRFRRTADGDRFAIYAVIRDRACSELGSEVRRQTLSRMVAGLIAGAEEGRREAGEFVNLRAHVAELYQIADDSYPDFEVAFEDRIRAVILLAEIADRFGWSAPTVSRLRRAVASEELEDAAARLRARVHLLRARSAAALAERTVLEEQLAVLSELELTRPEDIERRALEAVSMELEGKWVAAEGRLEELIGEIGSELPGLQLRATMQLFSALVANGKTPEAVNACVRAIQLADESAEWGRKAWSQIQMTMVLADLGRVAEAEHAMAEAVELIERYHMNLRFSAFASYAEALVAVQGGEYGRALQCAREAAAAFLDNRDHHGAGVGASIGVIALCAMGRWEEAAREGERLLRDLGEAIDRRVRAVTLCFLAVAAAGRGDQQSCDRWLDEADALGTLNAIFEQIRVVCGVLRCLGADNNSGLERVGELVTVDSPLYVRLAGASVTRVLGAALPVPDTFIVDCERCTITLPGGGEVDLSSRATLWRLLRLLAEQRVAWPGTSITRKALLDELWPDQSAESSKQNRLRVAIATLRKDIDGLLIQHRDDGYLISTENELLVRA